MRKIKVLFSFLSLLSILILCGATAVAFIEEIIAIGAGMHHTYFFNLQVNADIALITMVLFSFASSILGLVLSSFLKNSTN